jgi:hypothetical protein
MIKKLLHQKNKMLNPLLILSFVLFGLVSPLFPFSLQAGAGFETMLQNAEMQVGYSLNTGIGINQNKTSIEYFFLLSFLHFRERQIGNNKTSHIGGLDILFEKNVFRTGIGLKYTFNNDLFIFPKVVFDFYQNHTGLVPAFVFGRQFIISKKYSVIPGVFLGKFFPITSSNVKLDKFYIGLNVDVCYRN